MKKLLGILLLTILVHAEHNASMLYDGGLNALIYDKKSFYVTVNDEVTGGCLPKPKQLKKNMESRLKKNGFIVVDKGENGFVPEVYVSALGFKLNGMCVVDVTINMYFPIVVNVPNASNVPTGDKTYVRYNYYVGRHIFNYQRKKMQRQLNKTMTNYADKIYMNVSKAKDDIFKKFPEVEASFKAQ